MKSLRKALLVIFALTLIMTPSLSLAAEGGEGQTIEVQAPTTDNIQAEAQKVVEAVDTTVTELEVSAPEAEPIQETDTTVVESQTTVVEEPQEASPGSFLDQYGLYIIILLIAIVLLALIFGRKDRTKEVYVERQVDPEDREEKRRIERDDIKDPELDNIDHLDDRNRL